MNRIDVIQAYINLTDAKTYLEIGVRNGDSFLPIRCQNKIGVDIQVNSTLLEHGEFYEMSSDDFFRNHPKEFDVAFIDGDHSYRQSLKDFLNCFAWVNKGGVIILHDCNPASPEMATPKMGSSADWCGEVWKTIVRIRSVSYLRVSTFDCDFGVAVVELKENENRLNVSKQDIENMTYKDLESNRELFLNLVPA